MKKILFIDFDDTLYVHNLEQNDPIRVDLTPHILDERSAFYEKNGHLSRELLYYCIAATRFGCDNIVILTKVNDSIEAESKEMYLKKEIHRRIYYDFVALSQNASKAKFISDYCKAMGLQVSDAMILDDNQETILECSKLGIEAILPQEIFCD